jgi:VWFA-related protein
MRRALIIFSLCLAPSILAQVRETMTVEVVEVPVYVTGADGKPLHGLTRDEFELRVNGKPQAIEYFDSVDLVPPGSAGILPASKTAGETPALPARQRRLYLLVFDTLFGTKDRIGRAQHAAEAMIDRPESANDLYAVAVYTPTDGLRLVTSFIRDRAMLRHAIYSLRPADEKDPLGIAISPSTHGMWSQHGGAELADELHLTGEQREMIAGSGAGSIDNKSEAKRRLVMNQLGDLEAVAKRLRGLEGQKHVVIFSSGWDWRISIIPGEGYNEYPDIHARTAAMARAFKDSGAFLYGIDTAGVRLEKHAMIDSQEGLRRAIRPTGGDLIANANDFTQSLTTLAASQESVYILGFQRHDNNGGDIDVRVKNLPHGARIAFRPGFGKAGAKGDVDALELADIIINDVPQSGVTLNAGVTMLERTAEVAVSFARAEVVPQLLEKAPAVDVMLYLFDANGATVGFKAKRVSFDAAARVNNGYVTIREPFDGLPPGRYAAKVLLRIAGTNALGFVRKDFTME